MRRHWPESLLLLFLLGSLGGLAWLTWHPDSALLHRASRWPYVGPWVERFQWAYLPPSPNPTPPPEPGEPVVIHRVPEYETLGAQEYVWLEPGTRLLAEPRAGAPAVWVMEAYANLPVVERQGQWARLRQGSHRGWVLLPEPQDLPPPLGRDPEPPRPLPARPPDPEWLAVARSFLSGNEASGFLGPYALYTDAWDSRLLRYLHNLVSQVEGTYIQRYGLQPVSEAAEAVVLFARLKDYQDFLRQEERLAHLPARGHTARGVVALFWGFRSPPAVGETLVHELAHLLNRRSLGPALPPWLDEGIAEDLAYSRLDETGSLEPRELGGEILESSGGRHFRGAPAALILLDQGMAEGRTLPLPALLALPWEEFVDPGREQLHYAQSAFFVRYLMEGEEGRLAPDFRAFLRSVAAGGSVVAEALQEPLGREWTELEEGFREWVQERVMELGEGSHPPG